MSIKIAKIKNYLKETYQKLGEAYYAHYWNLGYINCLKDEERIDKPEFAELSNYNNRLCFIEDMKIKNRKIAIKEEEDKIRKRIDECIRRVNKKEELKEMELKRIKKRIDESLQFVCRDNSFTNLEDCHDLVMEAKKALNIYKELIEEYEKIRNPVYDFGITIKRLEEKYYPQPKTTKGKLGIIIDENFTLKDRRL